TTGINSPNKSNNFEISDNYIVKTTWGHSKNKEQYIVQLNIRTKKSEFTINYSDEFAETVTSTLSASNTTLIYQQ
ncbi:10796_t:CDS:1, partial [Racocetra persica]